MREREGGGRRPGEQTPRQASSNGVEGLIWRRSERAVEPSCAICVMHDQGRDKGAGHGRKPAKKPMVGGGDRAFGCARSRTESVRKGNRRRNCQVAQALGRVERSPENERLPISDVDVDLLHQSRRAKPASPTEADPRSGERKIARAVRAESLSAV